MTTNTPICRNFMHQRCTREDCKFLHDPNICFHFWKYNNCKFDTACKKQHTLLESRDITHSRDLVVRVDQDTVNTQNQKKNPKKKNKDKYNKNKEKKKLKNTESFVPIDKHCVDMRIVTHLSQNKTNFDELLTTKDVVIVPDLFLDDQNATYDKLVEEIENCGIPQDELLKPWHGNNQIKGTHFIADDHLDWKSKCPTFNYVISKIKTYFNMDVKTTRFNLYKNHNDWKPLHHDASAIKPHIAKIQNFTLAISFGSTRDAVFEKTSNDQSKTYITIPQPNGSIYAFCNDTNVIWKHGILPGRDQGTSTQNDTTISHGRISIILWGWMNNIQ
jgi:uncharacterized LabA/DUF88 family protein